MLRKPVICAGAGLFAVAVTAGALAYRRHHRYKHFAIHDPGMVYRSAWLEPEVVGELIERHQFRAVINLCKPGELGVQRWDEERAVVAGAGARLFEASMPGKVDPDDPNIAEHIKILSNPDNYPMLGTASTA